MHSQDPVIHSETQKLVKEAQAEAQEARLHEARLKADAKQNLGDPAFRETVRDHLINELMDNPDLLNKAMMSAVTRDLDGMGFALNGLVSASMQALADEEAAREVSA